MRAMLAAAVILAAAPRQQAAPPDLVYITFNSAVRVPGARLEPGSYVFVPGRPVAGKVVIDVYRAGDMSLAASCPARESEMPRPSSATLVDYAGSTPPYLRAWFHPALPGGFEFVYAPDEARTIAAASGMPVPSAVVPKSPGAAAEAGPVDQLMLARLAILTHLHEVRPASALRLRALNRQLADLTTAYWTGTGDVVFRLRLVRAALGNAEFPDDHAAVHLIEHVRERVERFAAFLH